MSTTSAEREAEAKQSTDFAELSIATVGGLALALIAMFLLVVPLAGNVTSTRDFVVFWATGQQLAHHADPYSAEEMGGIERAAGLPAGYGILYMRNPPWALPLALPLGYMGFRAGALIWSLVLLACLLSSGWLVWQMQGRPRNRIHWLAFSFVPSLICLFMGQTALFSLLGLTLFLRWHRTRPFTAGMALWLCALKPHLFIPFGIVLVVWAVASRKTRIFAGAALALSASCAATALLDASAWSGYSAMMRAPGMEKEFIPCLSVAMRLWLNPHAMWLQYLPVSLACAWALVFYWRRRERWDWERDGALLMLASLVAAPYCWLYDQALALPALLKGAYCTRSRALLAILALANVPIVIALLCGFKVISAIFLAAAPAWLAWYLAASALRKPTEAELPSGDL